MDHVSATCFLAFLVTTVLGLGDHFYTLTNVTSWEHANRSCTLATPRINYSAQGLILDFGDDLKSVVGQYWVGYTTHSFIVQNIGCSLEEDVAGLSIRNFTLPSPRPGWCYSVCATDVFGVKDGQCYCFETRPDVDVHKQTCDRSCRQLHPEIKCGGTDTVSLFKAAHLTLIDSTITPGLFEYCIAFDTERRRFIWENCSTRLKTRCQTEQGPHLVSSEDQETWSKSSDNCFFKRSNTMSNEIENLHLIGNEKLLWTGYFRTDHFIRTFNDCGTPVLFGHVYINEKPGRQGQPKMTFDHDRRGFDAICIREPDSTMFTTATESTKTTPENRKEMLPIKIGVPLLIVACVAAISAGAICYKRRRSQMKPSIQAPNIVEKYSQIQDPYDDAQNVYNEPFDKVIESKTSTGKLDHENRSMPNYGSEYETTGTGNSATKRKAGDNVYNTLELVTDDTYDHVNGPNNTRDTRANKPGSRNAKAGYGVWVENTYNRVDIEEGSYSHMNAGIRQHEATDNVYN